MVLLFKFILYSLLTIGIAKLATECDEWETKYYDKQWKSSSSTKCRRNGGSSSIYCCRLYSHLDSVLHFFTADPPTGLGCDNVRDKFESNSFAKFYSSKCEKYARSFSKSKLKGKKPVISSDVESFEVNNSKNLKESKKNKDKTKNVANSVKDEVIDNNPKKEAEVGDTNSTALIPITDNGTSIDPDLTKPSLNDTKGTNGTIPNNTNSQSTDKQNDSIDPAAVTPSVCFHRSGLVELRNGEMRRMEFLRVGDEVAVGGNQFSAIYMFSHRSNEIAEFVNITTTSGRSLVTTLGHFVHAPGKLVRAGDLRMGDKLMGTNGEVHNIVSVRRFIDYHVFNPHTLNGNIAVNGLMASTYTAHIAMNAAHPALIVFRSVWRVFRWHTDALKCGVPTQWWNNHGDCVTL